MKQKTRFKHFGNISYQYQLSIIGPKKSQISQSLATTFP